MFGQLLVLVFKVVQRSCKNKSVKEPSVISHIHIYILDALYARIVQKGLLPPILTWSKKGDDEARAISSSQIDIH